jgi:hypothetical protein
MRPKVVARKLLKPVPCKPRFEILLRVRNPKAEAQIEDLLRREGVLQQPRRTIDHLKRSPLWPSFNFCLFFRKLNVRCRFGLWFWFGFCFRLWFEFGF